MLETGRIGLQESYLHLNGWKESGVLLGSVPDALRSLFAPQASVSAVWILVAILLATAALLWQRKGLCARNPGLTPVCAGFLASIAVYVLFHQHELIVLRYLFRPGVLASFSSRSSSGAKSSQSFSGGRSGPSWCCIVSGK